MNETNILKHVEVPHVNADFTEMYGKQMELQARLGQLPTSTVHMAEKCIYWGHCIRAEIEELKEWLGTDEIKELQMEAIDIVHFVFNIGIEIGISDVDIYDIERKYEHETWELDNLRIVASTNLLSKHVVDLINLLPWKTWKTYKSASDVAALHYAYEKVIVSCLLLCNGCGLGKQDIINMYFAKNKVNIKRQDDGY